MGSHVVDGCGEFMPNGQEGTMESFTCAACNCHRNFHRKHEIGATINKNTQHHQQQRWTNIPNSNSLTLHHHHHPQQHHRIVSSTPMMMLTNATMAGAESSGEDLEPGSSSASKKRSRTKFTQEQKERMMEFADKLGWKIQKQDEQEIRQFCSQVGVQREVFKVWMHNNKHKQQQQQM